MKLTVHRKYRKETYTIGELYIDGVFFCHTLEDKDRGLKQTDDIAHIKAVKVPSQTAIPLGTYKVSMDIVSPKYSKVAFYQNLCNGKVPRIMDVPGFDGILIHCLHPEMEILTEKGWLNMEGFRENKPEKCWSLNIATNKMELVPIDKFIVERYIGDLYCCEYQQGLYNCASYRVTDEHIMLCDIPLVYGAETRFVKAKDIPVGSSFVCHGNTSVEYGVDEPTLVLCKLCMHLVADGYVRWYDTKSGIRSTVTFHYKKERKINRVTSLLEESGLRFSVHKNKDRSTVIRVLHPDSDRLANMVDPHHLGKDGKCIPESFTMLPKEQMISLIEEYHFADGKYANMKKDNYQWQISSTNVDTLNKIQTMAFLSGFSSSMYHERHSNTDKNWKDGYLLSIYKDKPTRTPAKSCYIKKPYNGDVFCVRNRNHTIVVRNSMCDTPFIIGNCGNDASATAGCLLVGKNTAVGKVLESKATFTELYGRMKKAHDAGEEITIEYVW